jgi:predicted deacylase
MGLHDIPPSTSFLAVKPLRKTLLALMAAGLLLSSLTVPAEPVAGTTGAGAGSGEWGPLHFLGRTVAPGETAKMGFTLAPSFDASFLDTLIVVIRGVRPGPTLCITAGIHGDEINGVEIAHRLYTRIRGSNLAGTLIVVPAVNSHGFRTGSRYLPDRRDLNRFFPGSPKGSTASLIAHAVFQQVVLNCGALIDLHTGSDDRTNLPQIRTDLKNSRALDLARSFGAEAVLDGLGPQGSLRRAALDAGIPAVIYEAGLPLRFEEEVIARGYTGIRRVMAHLGMLPPEPGPAAPSRIFRRTLWVRTLNRGGIFLTDRRPGDPVRRGDLLGTVADPITEAVDRIIAPVDGVIIGMAVPRVVLPGYALFHLGSDAATTPGADPLEERD